MREKKKSLGYKIYAGIMSVLLVVATGLIIFQLIKLKVLPNNILYPVIAMLVLIDLILIILLCFSSWRIWSKILSSILVIAMIGTMGIGNWYLYSTGATLEKVTTVKGEVKNTISVISLSAASNDLKDYNGKDVGVLKSIDKKGTKKSLKDIKKQDVSINKVEYDNVPSLVKALYDGEVQAIILNEAYRENVVELEDYASFDSQTQVVYQTIFYTNESNEALAVSDITTTPFTVLISGNDSYGSLDEVSRSDVDMLITINPVTSTILMVSIPRDSFVEEVCDDYACNYGAVDKLTHTGIYGVDTTKATIENLLGIEINYTFRINFSGAMDIVDALGGIDVEVAEGMAVSHFYTDSSLEGVTEGWNHLDGKRAVAYARERKAYLDGDTQRARNQQQVIQACVKKATSSAILTQYTSILNAVSNAFDTNMSMDEITSFIQYQIQAMPNWKFENYVLKGYNDMQVSPELGTEVSVVELYDSSITAASKKIKAVLEGKSSDTVEAEEDVPAGTLSTEEIEAQIEAGKYTETNDEERQAYYDGEYDN
jgi:polyisoprenyl-teichoic acid--peptidoglycan teichoic acid transferase